MKKIKIVSIITGLLVSSCATLQEAEIPERDIATKPTVMTKSDILDSPMDSLQMLSKIQSSHVMTLIRSVIEQEGVYVQSLTLDDLKTLGISEEDIAFAEEYIQQLNSTKSHD